MTLTPYPWQIEDAALLASHRRWMLANEMRTGKTGSAILGAIQVDARRIGVVCPAIVTREWAKQLDDFETRNYATWTIESYDKVVRRGVGILGNIDLLILDEAHYLKTPDAKRTVAIYGDQARERGLLDIPRLWCLTGTPAPNHAGEYYTHLKAFGLTKLSHWQFLNRFCIVVATPFGYRVTGNRRETLDELRGLLGQIMSRRTQRSVWKLTPEPFWSIRTLTPTPADAKALQELDRPWKGVDVTASQYGTMTRERRLLGLMKVPYVVTHVTDLLVGEQVPKVLIGVWHTEVLDQLRVAFGQYHPICINGDTGNNVRWELIERFQTAPSCRVAIVQMKTGGVGINLSAACHVVLAEPDWGRDVNEQFVQRPQHIARTVPLPVDLIALDGSLDETILRANVRKRRMNNEVTLDPSGPGAMAEPSLDTMLGVPTDAPISLTISDLTADAVQRITSYAHGVVAIAPDKPVAAPVASADPAIAFVQATAAALETEAPAVVKRGRGRPPKTLPANTAGTTVAHPGLVAPVPVDVPATPTVEVPAAPLAAAPPVLALVKDEPVAAAPSGEVTMDTLMVKARALGTGKFKQMALLAVLNAMGAPSLPKIAKSDYPAFDALLDAAVAYSAAPGASLEGMKEVCQHGHFDSATEALTGFVSKAMGL